MTFQIVVNIILFSAVLIFSLLSYLVARERDKFRALYNAAAKESNYQFTKATEYADKIQELMDGRHMRLLQVLNLKSENENLKQYSHNVQLSFDALSVDHKVLADEVRFLRDSLSSMRNAYNVLDSKYKDMSDQVQKWQDTANQFSRWWHAKSEDFDLLEKEKHKLEAQLNERSVRRKRKPAARTKSARK